MPGLLALLAAAQVIAADSVHLVIVATTDVHGRVRGWDYVRDAEAPGGLSRVATVVESLRAQYPGSVVLLDAGDLLQGDPFATYFATEDARQPHPIVDAMNAMGYDAATPGNHDFDFGLETLQRAIGGATFRYVSANVDRVEGPAATPLLPRATVVVRRGVRVAITGFTTPGVMVWNRVGLTTAHVRVRRVAEAGATALRGLPPADLRIALVHGGLSGASSYDTTGVGVENEAAALAGADPAPHLVIVGHTHREIRDTVIGGVHFVQPRNWARGVSVVHVWLVARDTSGGRAAGFEVARIRAEVIPTMSAAESPRIVRRVEQAHERVRAWVAQPIATAGPGFDGRYARAEDTPLLDFVNEVQRRRTGAQLSATAAFNVNAGFREGEIRLGDVAGVYPYENTLRAIRVSGEQLAAFLEHAARYYTTWQPGRRPINDSVPGYNFDVVEGADYVLDLSRPVGSRVRGLRVGGRPVAPGDSFTLALNSYRQEGGGGYTMLRGAPVVYDRGESVRDLLVEELRRIGRLEAGAFFIPSWSLAPEGARDAVRQAFAPAPPRVSEADSTLLRILALSDFHGALAPRTWPWSEGRAVGGAAALKTWLDSLARDCGCTVVRLDAGDQWQGTALSNFTRGRETVAAFNRFGIDAAAIGNHEFDWSVDTLRARMGEGHYQFVAANITDTTAGSDSVGRGVVPSWAVPWTVISRGAVKVSVIGVARRATGVDANPRLVRGLAFGDGGEAIRRVLPAARAAGDFVVVVAHEGAVCDSIACRGEIMDIARQLDSGAVDLIVAGHTHRPVNQRVNGIPIIEAGAYGNAIAVVDFVRVGTRVDVRPQLVTPYADAVAPDTGLRRLVADIQRRLDSVTSRPVARFSVPLRREGAEYSLGRLIADAQRNAGRADVAIMNNGGIRADLPAGTVSWGELYTVQPFENQLMRLTLSGAELLATLEHVVADGRPDGHVSGLELWYDPRRPAGQRITKTRLLTGRGIDRKRTYTLVVSEFLAAGGSGFAMLAGHPAENLQTRDIDALVRYLGLLPQPVDLPVTERLHRRDR